MNVLITGFPGTGKSTIAKELKARGRSAYDPEAMRGYMHLQSQETGRPIHMPDHAERGWFDNVGAFNWDTVRVTQLLEDAREDIFICSLADNMEPLFPMFDKMFVLTLDSFTLETRLRTRNDNYTKQPAFMADTLMLYDAFVARMLDAGAVPLDCKTASRELVDHILGTINN